GTMSINVFVSLYNLGGLDALNVSLRRESIPAVFNECNMTRARFGATDLGSTIFCNCQCDSADFSGSDFRFTTLLAMNFGAAAIDDAVFPEDVRVENGRHEYLPGRKTNKKSKAGNTKKSKNKITNIIIQIESNGEEDLITQKIV
ncbi:pentapeptide repeat-containing protein, partial [Rhizobium leguminosarum]|uniref:pentapeptide repeat-containing protein n=1 Tax=Rhizobium leguminosarum TaxID=384 RepID=UPI003F95531D